MHLMNWIMMWIMMWIIIGMVWNELDYESENEFDYG